MPIHDADTEHTSLCTWRPAACPSTGATTTARSSGRWLRSQSASCAAAVGSRQHGRTLGMISAIHRPRSQYISALCRRCRVHCTGVVSIIVSAATSATTSATVRAAACTTICTTVPEQSAQQSAQQHAQQSTQQESQQCTQESVATGDLAIRHGVELPDQPVHVVARKACAEPACGRVC